MNEDDASVALSAKRLVVYDNTFNTNKYGYKLYGYKLGLFTTVDRFGKTRIKSVTLMLSETRDMFAWVLQQFEKDIGQAAETILTDGDLWMAEAIALVWPHSAHHLCNWHFSKAVFRHIRPAVGGPMQNIPPVRRE